MEKFLNSNETVFRLARTIVQGVLGVIVANLDYIIGLGNLSAGTKALIVALVMAILSPIMSELGARIGVVDDEDEDDEYDEDWDENQAQLMEDALTEYEEDK